ncbi:MAG: response regulator [bacterium]
MKKNTKYMRNKFGNKTLKFFLLFYDDAYNIKLLKDYLLCEAFPNASVKEASNNELAFQILKNYYPDLIITDNMHSGGGFEFVSKIRTDPIKNAIPIILVSDYLTYEELKKMECNAYLLKPFLLEDMRKCIDNLISMPQQLSSDRDIKISFRDDLEYYKRSEKWTSIGIDFDSQFLTETAKCLDRIVSQKSPDRNEINYFINTLELEEHGTNWRSNMLISFRLWMKNHNVTRQPPTAYSIKKFARRIIARIEYYEKLYHRPYIDWYFFKETAKNLYRIVSQKRPNKNELNYFMNELALDRLDCDYSWIFMRRWFYAWMKGQKLHHLSLL